MNHTESGKDHFWPHKIQSLFFANLIVVILKLDS